MGKSHEHLKLDPADVSVVPENLTVKVGEESAFYLHSTEAFPPNIDCTWNIPDYGGNKCGLYVISNNDSVLPLPGGCEAFEASR